MGDDQHAHCWMALADFGLSNSLTNVVSDGYAKSRQDLAQSYVSAAFWSLAGIAAALALIFFCIWPHVPWYRVFNVRSHTGARRSGSSSRDRLCDFRAEFSVSIVGKIYGAYQEVAKGNAWSAAGNLLGLAALILVTQLKGGLVSLVIAVSGALLLVNALSAVWLFGWSKPWLRPRPDRVTYSAIHELTSLGGMFFVIQIGCSRSFSRRII